MNEAERTIRELSDKIAARFKYFINEKQLAEVLAAELLPLFNAGIVGAYAAAAKAVKNVEFTYSPDSTPRQEAIAAILALTPADARQAQQQWVIRCQDCGGAVIWKKTADGHIDVIHGCVNGKQARAAIASAEARARLEEASWWKPLAFTGHRSSCSFESSAGPSGDVCDCDRMERRKQIERRMTDLATARIADLVAAARTPDSTKEHK